MLPPLIDLALSSWYYDGATAKTRNLGVAGGTVQLGDGVTPATFPTQLGVAQGVQMGMSFNGSQYLQYLTAIPSGTYSVSMLVQWLGGACYLFDARDGGGAGYLYVDAGGVFTVSGGGTAYVNDATAASIPYGQVVCVTLTGNSFAVPSKLVIGAANNLGSRLVGNVYGYRMFAGTESPRQLRDQRQRMLARVHGP